MLSCGSIKIEIALMVPLFLPFGPFSSLLTCQLMIYWQTVGENSAASSADDLIGKQSLVTVYERGTYGMSGCIRNSLVCGKVLPTGFRLRAISVIITLRVFL